MKNFNLYMSALALSTQILFGAASSKNFVDQYGRPRPTGTLSAKQLNFGGMKFNSVQSGSLMSLEYNNLPEGEKIVAATAALDRDKDGKLTLQLAITTCPADHPNFEAKWVRERSGWLGDEGFVKGINKLPSPRCQMYAAAIPVWSEENYYDKDKLPELAADLLLLSEKQ